MTSKSITTGNSKSKATTDNCAPDVTDTGAKPSRLDQLRALLTTDEGATIAEMTTATGWQAHSVRGAMAGALKKRGLTITSEKIDGVRRYRASAAA